MASIRWKTSNRHPYSFPPFENEFTFTGKEKMLGASFDHPFDNAQRQQPWNRLSKSTTLASSRHDALYFDPKAPRDDLDFLLKSVYNNQDSLFPTKPDTCIQPETAGVDTGRVLHKHAVAAVKKELHLGHPLRIVAQEKRETLDSIKKAIVGHHSEITNKGFCRKPDGGYYQK